MISVGETLIDGAAPVFVEKDYSCGTPIVDLIGLCAAAVVVAAVVAEGLELELG